MANLGWDADRLLRAAAERGHHAIDRMPRRAIPQRLWRRRIRRVASTVQEVTTLSSDATLTLADRHYALDHLLRITSVGVFGQPPTDITYAGKIGENLALWATEVETLETFAESAHEIAIIPENVDLQAHISERKHGIPWRASRDWSIAYAIIQHRLRERLDTAKRALDTAHLRSHTVFKKFLRSVGDSKKYNKIILSPVMSGQLRKSTQQRNDAQARYDFARAVPAGLADRVTERLHPLLQWLHPSLAARPISWRQELELPELHPEFVQRALCDPGVGPPGVLRAMHTSDLAPTREEMLGPTGYQFWRSRITRQLRHT